MLGMESTVNLQSTLSASSAGSDSPIVPHHPITCVTTLSFDHLGALACEHTRAPVGDPRTQACLDHSLAILLLEMLAERSYH